MARIPYADCSSDGVRPLAERIVAERGSILHLYQMLMHSTPVAEGWLNYLTAIRQKSALSGAMRELIIMQVALLNNAPYEAEQHAPIALQEGVAQAKLDALPKWQECPLFDAEERAVLAYTDAQLSALYAPPQIVEITATVAAYNMVSRFLEALQIHSHDAR
jgi:alkylhydroperoxidase family enzyme